MRPATPSPPSASPKRGSGVPWCAGSAPLGFFLRPSPLPSAEPPPTDCRRTKNTSGTQSVRRKQSREGVEVAEKWTKSALWRPPTTSWLPLLHLRFTFLFPSLCGAPRGRRGGWLSERGENPTRQPCVVCRSCRLGTPDPSTRVTPAPTTSTSTSHAWQEALPTLPEEMERSPPPTIRAWGSVPQWLLLRTDSQFPRQGFDRRANSLSQPSSLHQLTVAFWTPTALPQQEALFPWRSTPSFPPPHPLAPS